MHTPWLLTALGLHAALGWVLLQSLEPTRVPDHARDHRALEAPALRAELLAEATLIRTQETAGTSGKMGASEGVRANAHARPADSKKSGLPPSAVARTHTTAVARADTPGTSITPTDSATPDASPKVTPSETPSGDTHRSDTTRADPTLAAAAHTHGVLVDSISVDMIRVAARSATPTPTPAVAPRVDASWAGNTPPPYPLAARRQGMQGKVRLDLLIETDGAVGDIRLRESSGSLLLDQSVMQTVKRWRFIPASQQGQTIAAWYPAWEWVFRLEEGS